MRSMEGVTAYGLASACHFNKVKFLLFDKIPVSSIKILQHLFLVFIAVLRLAPKSLLPSTIK